MYSKVVSGTFMGVHAYLVSVEVDATSGLPSFNMVGSLSCEVRESKERVWSALKNAGLDIPPSHITVNLSPADLRKEGTALDLPIAVAVLEALDYFPEDATRDMLFLGELGLNGEVKKVRGVLPIVKEAVKQGIKECIVPMANVAEGSVIPGIKVRGVSDIKELLLFLLADNHERQKILPIHKISAEKLLKSKHPNEENDFSQVNGQESAKRAALIAAAGFHNMLMVGPPGAGKSMIAKRIPGIMPPLSLEESIEVTSIASVAGLLEENQALMTCRPFQSPHHTISQAAMTGGGSLPRPGVISLAHRGVLFLDELPEFQRNVLDSLRQPIEERKVQVVRVNANLTYPANFMLICAMNPCPCGYYPDKNKCRCTEVQVKKYMSKISGPILDRIDLCVELHGVDYLKLHQKSNAEDNNVLRERVNVARSRQEKRFAGSKYCFNSDIESADIEKYCTLGKAEQKCMEELFTSLQLSARAYHRILKVARTIADLEDKDHISVEHLLEAALYRLAQEYWI